MVKFARQIMFVTLCWLLSSCVTQNFDKNKLVIEQNTSDQLLAMTRVSLGLGYSSDDLDTPARVVSAVKPIKDESAGHLTTTTRSIHTVVKDENLFSLSIKYNIKMKTLKRWNDFSDNLKIHIGDEIFISEPLRVDDTDD